MNKHRRYPNIYYYDYPMEEGIQKSKKHYKNEGIDGYRLEGFNSYCFSEDYSDYIGFDKNPEKLCKSLDKIGDSLPSLQRYGFDWGIDD